LVTQPQGARAEVFKRVFGTDTPLQDDGQVRWSGAIRSDLSLPAMSYSAGGEQLEGSPSRGSVTWRQTALQFQWQLDDVTLRGHGHAVQVKGLGVNIAGSTGNAALATRHRQHGPEGAGNQRPDGHGHRP
jgi:hypothetical protein